jgi:hypothetical protein
VVRADMARALFYRAPQESPPVAKRGPTSEWGGGGRGGARAI